MKTTIITFYLLIITLASCNKSEEYFTSTLPPATQTGENTFGCYIDGNLLVPRDGTGYYGGSDDGMEFSGVGTPPNYLFNEINVRDYKSETRGIMHIYFKQLHNNGEGIFNIENNENCSSAPALVVNIRCRMNNKWYCSIENTGTLTITRYDYGNRIVSGIFSCQAINRDDSNDIVDITEGRFDIKWNTLPNVDFP